MTGSLDDPKFRLGPLIWKAFVGLLTKIATAPFALIGKLFGGGPEVNFVEFEPGATALDPAGQEKMASVHKALVERPALQVDVPMAYSAELDGGLIERQALDASLGEARRQPEEAARRPAGCGGSRRRCWPIPRSASSSSRSITARRRAPRRRCPGEAAAFEALKKKERTPGGARGRQQGASRTTGSASTRRRPNSSRRSASRAAQSIQEALLGSGEVDRRARVPDPRRLAGAGRPQGQTRAEPQMKTYLAVFTGTAEKMAEWQRLSADERKKREQAGIAAWKKWVEDNARAIKDPGSPLGKTKRVTASGVTDIRNNLAAWTVVEAESHDAAARIFLNHPHFTIFPGDGIEIMECLPLPGA